MAKIRHHIKCVQYEAKNQNLQELERMNISIQYSVLYIHFGLLTFTVLCKILGFILTRIDGSRRAAPLMSQFKNCFPSLQPLVCSFL